MKSFRSVNLFSLIAVLFVASPAASDQTFLDDVIVKGSMCLGLDCPTSGDMEFGFDTIRMMENNLRIMFDDTSGDASTFPNLDWQIIVNDNNNGGEEYFGIQHFLGFGLGTCSGGGNDGNICGYGLTGAENKCNYGVCTGSSFDQFNGTACANDGACAGGTCEGLDEGTCAGETPPTTAFRIMGGAPADSLRIEPAGDLSVGGALDVAGDIELSGTVDGRDIAADGIVLDSLANATAPDLTSIQADISALQTGLGTAQGDIGTLQTNLGTAQGDIGTLQTNLGTAQGDIGTLQTDLGTAQGDIGTLQTDLGTAQGDIGTLQADLGTAQGDITTLQTDLGSVEGDIDTLQTDLAALQTLVGTVQSDLATHVADTNNPHGVTAEQLGLSGGGLGDAQAGIIGSAEFVLSRGQPAVVEVVLDPPIAGDYVVSLTNVTNTPRKTLRSVVSGKTSNGFTISVIRQGFDALEEVNWAAIPLS